MSSMEAEDELLPGSYAGKIYFPDSHPPGVLLTVFTYEGFFKGVLVSLNPSIV